MADNDKPGGRIASLFVRKVEDDEDQSPPRGTSGNRDASRDDETPVFGSRRTGSRISSSRPVTVTGGPADETLVTRVNRELSGESGDPAWDAFQARLDRLAMLKDRDSRYQAALATVDGYTPENILAAYDDRLRRLPDLSRELAEQAD